MGPNSANPCTPLGPQALSLQSALARLYQHFVVAREPPALGPKGPPTYRTPAHRPGPLMVIRPTAPYSEALEGREVDEDFPEMIAFRADLYPLTPAQLYHLQSIHDRSAVLRYEPDESGHIALTSLDEFRERFIRHLKSFCTYNGLPFPPEEA